MTLVSTDVGEARGIADLASAAPDGTAQRQFNPLDEDDPADAFFATTERGLLRVALVATAVGARFVHEDLGHDPMDWMVAPRALFRGRSAARACLELDACIRAVLLHGLGFGLDAEPEDVDGLASFRRGDDGAGGGAGRALADGALTLYTCIVEGPLGWGGRGVQAFCAMVVSGGEAAARLRLADRFGGVLARTAVVREGFSPDDALVEVLVSAAMRRMLGDVARRPGGRLGRSLDLCVEQRFAL